MAWDFQTEPEFHQHLDWAARFVREQSFAERREARFAGR
jgi:hypothetical protein